MDKRLGLAEVAAIWKPADIAGEPLTGTAAIEAVLKLVFYLWKVCGFRRHTTLSRRSRQSGLSGRAPEKASGNDLI